MWRKNMMGGQHQPTSFCQSVQRDKERRDQSTLSVVLRNLLLPLANSPRAAPPALPPSIPALWSRSLPFDSMFCMLILPARGADGRRT